MTTRPYTVERNAMNEQTDRITLLERRVEELERRAQAESKVETPAQTITVGDEGDPVRVELTLDGAFVRMKVLHTDKALLGQGTIYEADGLQLCSECGPALELTAVWLWGRVSKYDSSVGVMSFASPAYAIEYRTRVAAFIAGFNASQRKPAAKPEPAAPTLLEAAKEWSCQWAPNEMPCMMADRKLLAAIAQEEAKGKYVCCPECGTRGAPDRFVRVDSMAGPCRHPMADAWQARAEKAEAKLAQAEADLATAKADGDLAWRLAEAYVGWMEKPDQPWRVVADKYNLPLFCGGPTMNARAILDARKKGEQPPATTPASKEVGNG